MTTKRYFSTYGKPRQPWPGEMTASFTPPDVDTPPPTLIGLLGELDQARQRIAELEAENDMLVNENLQRADNAYQLRGRITELEASGNIIATFCQRFDTWIMNQSETVRLSSGLAFGEEYNELRESVRK